jgi:Leucine rich repeat
VIEVGDIHRVTDVSRNHLAGRDNSDVKGLSITNQDIGFLPFNIHEFFPNLETIDATNAFKEISREALIGFPKLRQLHLNTNKIQIIEPNLFEGNPNMIAISFVNNPVKHVAYNVFTNLTSLHSLRFDFATCHSQAAELNRANVELLMFRLLVNCPPTFAMTENKILSGIEFEKTIDEQIAERVNPLMWTIHEMNDKIKELEERLARLEN